MFRAHVKAAIAAPLLRSLPTLLIALVSLPGSADELYKREGIIDSLASCLKIAGQSGAEDLWRQIQAVHTVNRDEDAGLVLAEIDDYRPPPGQSAEASGAEHAFSIVLTCAHVVHAWDEYGSANRPGDFLAGRGLNRRHQALVIAPDDQERRLRLPPGPLVRLLGAPNLLPPAYVSGLVIKDAVIDGPLLLNHTVVSSPLTFTNVVFRDGDYPKEIFGEPNTRKRAVSMLGVRFHDQVSFSQSTFCGEVMIKDSHFEERLLIKYTNEPPDLCASPGMRSPSRGEALMLGKSLGECRFPDDFPQLQTVIRIYGSHFGLGLSITDSWIHKLDVADSKSHILTIENNLFYVIEVANNSLATSYIKRNIVLEKIEIIVNRLEGDLWLTDRGDVSLDPLRAIGGHCDPSIAIDNNHMGGGLGFIRRSEYFQSEAASLKSNVAENGSVIELPKDWRGKLDLTGSQFLGTFELRHPSKESKGLSDRRDRFCPPADDPVYIDLTGVQVRMLTWNLPLGCNYRWQGTGLRYDVWQASPDDDAAFLPIKENDEDAQSPQTDAQSLQRWRLLLWDPRADELHAISDYLDRNGWLNDSRKILEEAKRLNYAPDCSPGDPWYKCLVDAWPMTDEADAENSESVAQADVLGDLYVWLEHVWKWEHVEELSRRIVLFALAPVGYGARPEFALLLLGLTPIGFWLFYGGYRFWIDWRARRRWNWTVRRLKKSVVSGSKEEERLNDINGAFATAWSDRSTHGRDIFDRLKDDLMALAQERGVTTPKLDGATIHYRNLGNSAISGFSQFEEQKLPRRFFLFLYSLDSMLPVVDLHHYSNYYPESRIMRAVPVIQQILGWWWSTVFVAAAAIL